MSILIQGMEMPKNCKDCPFSDHEAWCLIPGSWRERYYCPDDERSADCPLIELPPHGRLGDLDELITAFPRCDNSMDIKIASVRATINHAPTIIEAEGET